MQVAVAPLQGPSEALLPSGAKAQPSVQVVSATPASPPHPDGSQLIVLELLSASWAHSQGCAIAAVVQAVLRGPDVFALPFMHGATYRGIHSANRRAAILVDASVLPMLRQHVAVQLQLAAQDNPQSLDGTSSAASGNGNGNRNGNGNGSGPSGKHWHHDKKHHKHHKQAGLAGGQQQGFSSGADDTTGGEQTEGTEAEDSEALGSTFNLGSGTDDSEASGRHYISRVVKHVQGMALQPSRLGWDDRDDSKATSGADTGAEEPEPPPSLWHGMTPRLLPEALPPSVYAGEDYGQVCRVDLSDAKKCLAVFKVIMKHNRDAKKEQQRKARLREARWQLQQARAMVGSSPDGADAPADAAPCDSSPSVPRQRLRSGVGVVPSVLVSVDLEWYEGDQSKLLEIGWTCWDSVTRTVTSKHWIIQENEAVRNGRYVPDHKHCFLFGKSVVGSKREGALALQRDLQPETWAQALAGLKADGPTAEGGDAGGAGPGGTATAIRAGAASADGAGEDRAADPQEGGARGGASVGKSSGDGRGSVALLPRVALVGHGMAEDLKLMSDMGITVPPGTQVLDTSTLAWALLGGTQVQYSLRALLNWLEVPDVTKLHNAGNDAKFTLEALLRMCQTP